MSVSCSRLRKMLAEHGFVPARVSSFTHACGFVRDDANPNLYQQVEAAFAGRRQEATFAYVDVSVTKWFAVRGLCESRIVREVATDPDPERCRAYVRSLEEAKAWEESLVRVAPLKAAELALEQGSDLLERTSLVRSVARDVLWSLDQRSGVASETERLRSTMPPEMADEAERLASRQGVIQLPGAKATYLLACLAVLQGDKSGEFVGQNPLLNKDLMWQIDLVADGILCWDENAEIRSGAVTR